MGAETRLDALRIVPELDASGFVQGARQVTDSTNAMGAALQKAGDSSAAVDKKLVERSGAFESLRRQLDPTIKSTEQYEKAQGTLSRALERGKVSQDDYNRFLELARQRHEGIGAAVNTSAASHGRLTQAVGQAGFQIQDFAVQVQGGTSALTALSQQGSQLLGIFGAGGAIAGAILTVGVLAVKLLGLGEASKSLTDTMKEQDAAYTNVIASSEAWASTIDKEYGKLLTLQRYYTSLTGSVREFEAARLRAAGNDLARGEMTLQRSLMRPGSGILQNQEMQVPDTDAMGNFTGGLTGAPSKDPRTVAFSEALRVYGDQPLTTESIADLHNRMQALASGGDAVAQRARETMKLVREASEEVAKLEKSRQQLDDQKGALNGTLLPLPADDIPPTTVTGSRARSGTDPMARVQRDAGSLMKSMDDFWDDADKRAEKRAQTESDAKAKKLETELAHEETRRNASFDRTVENYSSQLSKGTVDALFDGVQKGQSLFSGLASSFGRAMRTALAGALDTMLIRPFLSEILSGLGFTGSTGSGGGITLGSLGSLTGSGGGSGGGFSLSSISNFTGLSKFGDSAGGGWFSGDGMFSKSSIDSYGQSSGLFGNGISSSAQGPLESGATLDTLSQSGTFGTSTATGALGGVGSALGGIGAGYGIGSTIGGLVAGKSKYKQQNAQIGAAIGSVGGAFFGPVGSMVGGALGGAIGGLFGPSKAHNGGDVVYGVVNGQLQIIGSGGKNWDSAAALADTQGQLNTINSAFGSRGLSLTGGGGMVGYGPTSKNPGSIDPNSLAQYLTSDNANVKTALQASIGKSLNDILSDVDWVKGVYEPTIAGQKEATSAFVESLNALNAQFEPVISKATALGLATTSLTEAWTKAIADMGAARNAAVNNSTYGLMARGYAAAGQSQNAELLTHDLAAGNERTAYRKQLTDWGLTAAQVEANMNMLVDVEGMERLAIVKKYADQTTAVVEAAAQAQAQATQSAAGSAANAISGIGDYLRNIRGGSNSPLSASSQYGIAGNEFNAVLGAAQAGDANSIGKLTSYADTFLNASRAVNGSGTAYAQDYSRVTEALGGIANIGADTLTASFMAVQVQTQTATLVQSLETVRAELAAVRVEIAQGSSRPARAA